MLEPPAAYRLGLLQVRKDLVAYPLSVARGIKELGLVLWYRCWETGRYSHGPMARTGRTLLGVDKEFDLVFWHRC
jgi:hypothetical protein